LKIAVVDYGMGNIRSVSKALEHVAPEAGVLVTSDPAAIRAADRVVVPGQGAMPDCMRQLAASGAREAVIEATRSKPFLGICVGMQMLFDGSDESPDVAGLGIVPGRITRLPETVRLPQMGWNTLEPQGDARLLAGLPDPAWCYFVHTFAPEPRDRAVVAAWCDYGRRFAAAIERGPLWATQFHPEKSGDVGLAMLGNFVTAAAA
jgi:glutamine amidotransferase